MSADTYRKIVVTKLSSNFREATEIQTHSLSALLQQVQSAEVVIQIAYVGINASDVNFTAGKYMKDARPPFDAGFEGVGTVLALGSAIKPSPALKIGSYVAFSAFGAFGEVVKVHRRYVHAVPAPIPETLPILVSGTTASIALEQVGEIQSVLKSKKKVVVLVTAAAGGTGIFAVQLAKLAGPNVHVIGTCSSDDKKNILQQLGADRVVNYKKENLDAVLRKEYPQGVDIVYESVGGQFLDIGVKHLAVKGKLIIIGFISGYSDQSGWSAASSTSSAPASKAINKLPWYAELLRKSASCRGFFLEHFPQEIPRHIKTLAALQQEGKLKHLVDQTKFTGLEDIPKAIDHMYQGKNVGKVVVAIAPVLKSKL